MTKNTILLVGKSLQKLRKAQKCVTTFVKKTIQMSKDVENCRKYNNNFVKHKKVFVEQMKKFHTKRAYFSRDRGI